MNERKDDGFTYELPEDTLKEDSKEIERKKKRVVRLLNSDREVKTLMKPVYEAIQDDYDLAGNVKVGEGDFRDIIHSHITRMVARKIRMKRDIHKWKNKSIKKLYNKNDKTKKKYSVEIKQAILDATVNKLMEIGNVYNFFKGRQGAFFRDTLFGDAFGLPTWDDTQKAVVAKLFSIDNVVIDQSCTDVRNAPDGKSLNHFGVIWNFDDFDEAVETFPEIEEVRLKWGNMPTKVEEQELSESDEQYTTSEGGEKKEGQVFMEVDVSNKCVTYWAGESMTIIKEVKGDDFPYMDYINDVPVNPLYRSFFSERSNGFYNDGVGHLVSERTQADTEIKNATIRGAKESAFPMRVMNVQEGKEALVQQYIEQGIRDVNEGYHGVIFNPVDRDGNSTISGKIENLSNTTVDSTGMNIFDNMVDKDIINMGVNLKDVYSDPNKTASAVSSDNMSSNESIRDAGKQNAQAFEDLLNMIISMSVRLIDEKDKRPLEMPEYITDENYELEFTLGDGITLLKTCNAKADVVETTGIMSDASEEIEKGYQLLQTVAPLIANPEVNARIISNILAKHDIVIDPKDITKVPNQQQNVENIQKA